MAESIPITDSLNLASIRTNVWQDRRLAKSDIRQVYALDTETDQNGDIFLIADSEGRYLDKITPESCLKWLFSKRYQGTWNFFYNITFDAEVILKLLGDNLYSYKISRKLRFKFDDYTIEYFPSKKLAIRKGHHSTVFFDIAQYYHASLVNAYQSNIRKLDSKYLETKQKQSSFSKWFFRDNKKLVTEYCIIDCKLTKELAEHWINLFDLAFGFYPQRWISSGYLAEKVLINNKIPIPKFDEIPYKIQEFAWNCYYGGRFEILKRGFIGSAYLYDINSAYPYVLANIPDITKGRWVRRKSINPDSSLGFFKIECDIPDCKYIPPFPFRINGKIIFPSGRFQTFCTLAELKACEDTSFYKILDSWQFVTSNPSYPYKEFVEDIYNKRLQLKQEKNPLQLPLKIILNSIYGKTAQRVKGRIGNLFCPVIASTITGTTRAMLYDFVIRHGIERDVISFATDSIITSEKIDVNSTELGGFALENSGSDVYVLQNGIYRFNGKWKKRGIGNLGSKQIEHVDTMEKDGKLYQVLKILRSGRLRRSILSDCVCDIGKFKTIERRVNLNADQKRLWFENIKNINIIKQINSLPLSLNYVLKI